MLNKREHMYSFLEDITNHAVAEKFSKEFNLRIILLKH